MKIKAFFQFPGFSHRKQAHASPKAPQESSIQTFPAKVTLPNVVSLRLFKKRCHPERKPRDLSDVGIRNQFSPPPPPSGATLKAPENS